MSSLVCLWLPWCAPLLQLLVLLLWSRQASYVHDKPQRALVRSERYQQEDGRRALTSLIEIYSTFARTIQQRDGENWISRPSGSIRADVRSGEPGHNQGKRSRVIGMTAFPSSSSSSFFCGFLFFFSPPPPHPDCLACPVDLSGKREETRTTRGEMAAIAELK